MKFRRSDRLVTRRDFSRVFDAAHEVKDRKRILRVEPYVLYTDPQKNFNRLGLSVSRRVVRKAHDRNRVKRCVREFYRNNRDLFFGDTIVRLVSAPKDYSYEALVAPLERALFGAKQQK